MPTHDDVRITRYARERMAERGVTVAEVYETVLRPEIVEPSNGARRFVRGELVVVVLDDNLNPGGLAVRNVLWRKPWRWTSEEMRRDRKR